MLALDGARVGVLVCYEQLFPDLARALRNAGAEFQVVITNDAWFGRTFFQRYQADALRLRAIENRSAFVRVANTGISGFVDRSRAIPRTHRLFEKAVEVSDVRLGRAHALRSNRRRDRVGRTTGASRCRGAGRRRAGFGSDS